MPDNIEFTGWVAKSVLGQDDLFNCGEIGGIYEDPGQKKFWHDIDWPPRKVKVTVEFVE